MSATEWHVDERLWKAYAAGRLDAVAGASIDAHVMSCTVCQASAATAVEPAVVGEVWAGIREEVRRPVLPWTLRWLRRFRVPEEDLVVLAASHRFALPWAMAVGSALLCAFLVAFDTSRQHEIFLLLAPLVPVYAVVAAFDATEDLRDLARATPYSKLRLALLRTTATLAVALPATLAVGLTIPGLEPLAVSWLLPALALTSAVLLLLTWLGAWTASLVTAATWAVVVAAATGSGDVTVLTGAVGQAGFLALGLLLCTAVWMRTTSYRLLGGEG